jgi:hypothetical protein
LAKERVYIYDDAKAVFTFHPHSVQQQDVHDEDDDATAMGMAAPKRKKKPNPASTTMNGPREWADTITEVLEENPKWNVVMQLFEEIQLEVKQFRARQSQSGAAPISVAMTRQQEEEKRRRRQSRQQRRSSGADSNHGDDAPILDLTTPQRTPKKRNRDTNNDGNGNGKSNDNNNNSGATKASKVDGDTKSPSTRDTVVIIDSDDDSGEHEGKESKNDDVEIISSASKPTTPNRSPNKPTSLSSSPSSNNTEASAQSTMDIEGRVLVVCREERSCYQLRRYVASGNARRLLTHHWAAFLRAQQLTLSDPNQLFSDTMQPGSVPANASIGSRTGTPQRATPVPSFLSGGGGLSSSPPSKTREEEQIGSGNTSSSTTSSTNSVLKPAPLASGSANVAKVLAGMRREKHALFGVLNRMRQQAEDDVHIRTQVSTIDRHFKAATTTTTMNQDNDNKQNDGSSDGKWVSGNDAAGAETKSNASRDIGDSKRSGAKINTNDSSTSQRHDADRKVRAFNSLFTDTPTQRERTRAELRADVASEQIQDKMNAREQHNIAIGGKSKSKPKRTATAKKGGTRGKGARGRGGGNNRGGRGGSGDKNKGGYQHRSAADFEDDGPLIGSGSSTRSHTIRHGLPSDLETTNTIDGNTLGDDPLASSIGMGGDGSLKKILGMGDYASAFEVIEGPQFLFHPLKDIDIMMSSYKPEYVIIYDPDITLTRQVEVYQAQNPNISVRVYLLLHDDSVEEQRYLTALQGENTAFEQLIKAKAHMVIPDNQDGKDTPIVVDQLPPTSSPANMKRKKKGAMGNMDLGADDGEGIRGVTYEAYKALADIKEASVNSTRKGGKAAASSVGRVIVDIREFRSSLPSFLHLHGLQIIPVTLEVLAHTMCLLLVLDC